jgi:hypothetical protein
MSSSTSDKAGSCCSAEKRRLMDELQRCNFCSSSREELHSCYREAARESGSRAKQCIVS